MFFDFLRIWKNRLFWHFRFLWFLGTAIMPMTKSEFFETSCGCFKNLCRKTFFDARKNLYDFSPRGVFSLFPCKAIGAFWFPSSIRKSNAKNCSLVLRINEKFLHFDSRCTNPAHNTGRGENDFYAQKMRIATFLRRFFDFFEFFDVFSWSEKISEFDGRLSVLWILRFSGFDATFCHFFDFLRFLMVFVKISFPISVIRWVVMCHFGSYSKYDIFIKTGSKSNGSFLRSCNFTFEWFLKIWGPKMTPAKCPNWF